MAEALSNNSDYFGQQPLTAGTDAALSNVDGNKETKNDIAPAKAMGPLDPCPLPLNGDFDIICPNGVRVIKKNGVIEPRLPHEEVYYIPAQI